MDQSQSVLRIEIDGRWSAEEMGASFRVLSELYNFRLLRESFAENQVSLEAQFPEEDPRALSWQVAYLTWRLSGRLSAGLLSTDDWTNSNRLSTYVAPEEKLHVLQVKYGSFGFKDLAGFGTIIGHLKDFIIYVLPSEREKRRLENRRRELENEGLEQEIAGMRIENARRFVALRREGARADFEERVLSAWADERQDVLLRLIQQGKIVNAFLRDGKGSDGE